MFRFRVVQNVVHPLVKTGAQPGLAPYNNHQLFTIVNRRSYGKSAISWKGINLTLIVIGDRGNRPLHFRRTHETSAQFDKSKMTEENWAKKLTDEQFYVCRKKGTEAPFTGKYCDHFEKGVYSCTCCGAELFSSDHKFRSGCGWPSFHTALGADNGDESNCNVARKTDKTHGMTRTEALCKKCDAHLGHVFKDGPKPTGERFCINSVSLQFTAKK